MPKLTAVLIFLFILFLIAPQTMGQTNQNIRIDTFLPSITPVSPPPTPAPTSPAPTNPIPPPSTPPPPRERLDLCPSLRALNGGFTTETTAATQENEIDAYNQQVVGFQDPAKFILVYVDPKYVLVEKEATMDTLKNSQKFENVSNKELLIAAEQDILKNTPLNAIYRATAGTTNVIDAVNFYNHLFRIIDSYRNAYEEPLLRVALATITNKLSEHNLPPLPFTVFNANAGIQGYPLAANSLVAANLLGCNNLTPPTVNAPSPLIHVYSSRPIELTIKPEVEVTYTYPDYSLVSGFKVNTNTMKGKYLYYEFVKERELESKIMNQGGGRVVVSGDKLRGYLLNTLVPSLDLTDKEREDFVNTDILPQLVNLECHPERSERSADSNLEISPLRHVFDREAQTESTQDRNDSCNNYEVILYQNEEVDKLVPLTIKPKPDTLIRNLIVVNSLSDVGYRILEKENDILQTINDSRLTIHDLQPRSGLVIVENGFIVLGR